MTDGGDREERLKQQLRANLRRRKQRARALSQGGVPEKDARTEGAPADHPSGQAAEGDTTDGPARSD